MIYPERSRLNVDEMTTQCESTIIHLRLALHHLDQMRPELTHFPECDEAAINPKTGQRHDDTIFQVALYDYQTRYRLLHRLLRQVESQYLYLTTGMMIE